MPHRSLRIVVLLLLTLWVVPIAAQTRTCDDLRGTQRELAARVLRTAHPHDCCDATIVECLAKRPACPLAIRLADDICRRAAAGQSQQQIERQLVQRAASALSPKVSIDVAAGIIAGDNDAPIEIVAYLCGRCPYCAKLAPQLYASVTAGKLKGKAKLIVRPFPVRSHPHSTLVAKAMLAAAHLGQFWPYVLHLYRHFDQFDPARMSECAAQTGMDPDQFRRLLEEPQIESVLLASKKEGVRNHVEATPALFINRRKYEAELSLAAVEDFVEEQLEARR